MTTISESETLAERLEVLDARLREMEDKEAIRDVLHRYCRGADRCDLELFRSCYWPDGTDCHGFFNGNAHEFAEFVIPLLAEIKNSLHSVTNPIIKFEGDRAFVDCQFYAFHVIPVDDATFIFQQADGHYLDVFEKRDGEWKILHRTFTAENGLEQVRQHTMVLDESLMPQPAPAARAPSDLSYKGFELLETEIVPVPGVDLWADVKARLLPV